MLNAAKTLLLVLSALFPIVNPLGGSPIFLAMTRDYLPAERKALSRRVALNSFFLLVGSYFVGTHILTFFGISLPVVQVGGGLIVISTGWTMLKQPDDDARSEMREQSEQHDPLRQAFYPLTLPLTVGPGSISVAITLGANAVYHEGVNVLPMVAALITRDHQIAAIIRFFSVLSPTSISARQKPCDCNTPAESEIARCPDKSRK